MSSVIHGHEKHLTPEFWPRSTAPGFSYQTFKNENISAFNNFTRIIYFHIINHPLLIPSFEFHVHDLLHHKIICLSLKLQNSLFCFGQGKIRQLPALKDVNMTNNSILHVGTVFDLETKP